MKTQNNFTIALIVLLVSFACTSGDIKQRKTMGIITPQTLEQVITDLVNMHGESRQALIQRGVSQVASFWMAADGTETDFRAFCIEHYKGNDEERRRLFDKLSFNYEKIYGHFNQMTLELNKALHLDVGPIDHVDILFGSYSASAHLSEDLFKNKIAYLTMLNFPFYSLEEKSEKGAFWSRVEWAYARMGDMYTSRVPAGLNQEASRIATASDNYVSEYNIMAGKLLDLEGNSLFPESMRLISHWGLRDEIKSNYGQVGGLEKQQMIYQVMNRIIHQEIPADVVNNPDLFWNPYTNKVFKDGEEIQVAREPDTRYQFLLDHFTSGLAVDAYAPGYPSAIKRAFDRGLEMSQEEVEELFITLMRDPILRSVGALVSQRLERELEPFDIWYDGFKPRSNISEEYLDQRVNQRYPSGSAFQDDLKNILVRLGWDANRANQITSKIKVEASRGAGHAWGAAMRSQYSYLRTRIGENGMDYKGYNIAIHEFGHNVEQTISIYDVDHYMMSGVPNTAFTEALAFIFQSRDLELLSIPQDDPLAEHLHALDKIWGTFEIMGVSLVDMRVWRWMYDNPDATAAQLREQTIYVATEVWNEFFGPVFQIYDVPILAIYSHMISYPLYLSAYPLGRLIELQLETRIAEKGLAALTDHVFTFGRLTPRQWMLQAVGEPLSVQPMIEGARKAVAAFDAQSML